jgi:uncharacterized protein YndB with AHSA1/START domain
MSVQKDASGYRSVQSEAEVPGTPEEVWQAIATGPGISSWFVPTQVEERAGGAVQSNFGPGMESAATITEWQPPLRFVAESQDLGPSAPPVATEWIVEARHGGTCTVRVVHRWFASTDDWDAQFEGHTHGWQAFFRILRLYLRHFSGQPCTAFQLMGMAPEPSAEAWAVLASALGLSGAEAGQHVTSAAGAPALSGIVEGVGIPEYPELLIRLEQPAPGVAHLFPLPMGGAVYLPIRLYLYGEQAAAAVAEQEPQWQAWLAAILPARAPE